MPNEIPHLDSESVEISLNRYIMILFKIRNKSRSNNLFHSTLSNENAKMERVQKATRNVSAFQTGMNIKMEL